MSAKYSSFLVQWYLSSGRFPEQGHEFIRYNVDSANASLKNFTNRIYEAFQYRTPNSNLILGDNIRITQLTVHWKPIKTEDFIHDPVWPEHTVLTAANLLAVLQYMSENKRKHHIVADLEVVEGKSAEVLPPYEDDYRPQYSDRKGRY